MEMWIYNYSYNKTKFASSFNFGHVITGYLGLLTLIFGSMYIFLIFRGIKLLDYGDKDTFAFPFPVQEHLTFECLTM